SSSISSIHIHHATKLLIISKPCRKQARFPMNRFSESCQGSSTFWDARSTGSSSPSKLGIAAPNEDCATLFFVRGTMDIPHPVSRIAYRGMSTALQLSTQAQAMLPTHVAIIMDGNGRWARQRHLPRVEGHRQGAESVRAIVRAAGEAGVKYLTLYAFSVENWNRPKDEVATLMKYLARYLKNEIGELNRNNVRLEVIGQVYRLPEFVQEQLRKTKAALSRNNGL